MKPIGKIFYYNRRKLVLYLFFNVFLLTLAVLFTLTIFPEYPAVYIFATGSCLLSVAAALIVCLLPFPAAIVTPQALKIDHNQPLPWERITAIQKDTFGCWGLKKTILRLKTVPLKGYHYTLMQLISAHSRFGAFSIPLYAMTKADAKTIEKLIRSRIVSTTDLRKKYRQTNNI